MTKSVSNSEKKKKKKLQNGTVQSELTKTACNIKAVSIVICMFTISGHCYYKVVIV